VPLTGELEALWIYGISNVSGNCSSLRRQLQWITSLITVLLYFTKFSLLKRHGTKVALLVVDNLLHANGNS
jgi:hypothetical protein